jgi:hypothetical protein
MHVEYLLDSGIAVQCCGAQQSEGAADGRRCGGDEAPLPR